MVSRRSHGRSHILQQSLRHTGGGRLRYVRVRVSTREGWVGGAGEEGGVVWSVRRGQVLKWSKEGSLC